MGPHSDYYRYHTERSLAAFISGGVVVVVVVVVVEVEKVAVIANGTARTGVLLLGLLLL